MAHGKRTYTATETVVQWVLGTKPNGKYLSIKEQDPLTSNIRAAKVFQTDKSAKEALALSVPAEFRGVLRVIRVSLTTRESRWKTEHKTNLLTGDRSRQGENKQACHHPDWNPPRRGGTAPLSRVRLRSRRFQ